MMVMYRNMQKTSDLRKAPCARPPILFNQEE